MNDESGELFIIPDSSFILLHSQVKAEREGFEPSRLLHLRDFQSRALDQLCDLSRVIASDLLSSFPNGVWERR